MKVEIEIQNSRYCADLDRAISIAIEMDFDGPQPSHFGADPARREPMKVGEFIGRTKLGGSCNVDVLKINPHCNGTHTETVGHIVDENVSVADKAMRSLFAARLITVQSQPVGNTSDSYRPTLEDNDRVIDAVTLQSKIECELGNAGIEALVIRSLPNSSTKLARKYGAEDCPAFFTIEAMEYIVSLGIEHLLVDLPSVDRLNDSGKMTNHHIFWQLETETPEPKTLPANTITEMIYVPDAVSDGLYLLNLQVPALITDAAPSRPILFPLLELQ